MHLQRGLHGVEERTVDTITNPGVLGFGFDMNVTGAFMKGIGQKVVDIFDDRRFGGAFLEVADVLLHIPDHFHIDHVAHDLVDIVSEATVVEFVANGRDIVFAAHHDVHGHTHLPLDVVDGKNVGRLTRRHDQCVVFHCDRHHMTAANIAEVKSVESAPVDVFNLNAVKLETVKCGFGLENVILPQAELDKHLFHVRAAFALLLLPDLVHLLGCDLAGFQEHIGHIPDVCQLAHLRRIKRAKTRRKRNLAFVFDRIGRPGLIVAK